MPYQNAEEIPYALTNRIISITYLLTPWCRVLLEKLTGLQLVKKFPAFHGTRRLITAHTSVRHLSLSWARPIQSIYPHFASWWSIIILSTHLHLGLPSGLFPSGFPTKTLYTPLSSPIRATCPAHLILLDFITCTILGEEYKSFSSSLSFRHCEQYLCAHVLNILCSALIYLCHSYSFFRSYVTLVIAFLPGHYKVAFCSRQKNFCFDFRAGARTFFSPKFPDRLWGHQPLVEGASEVVSAWVNQYGPESDHG